MERVPIDWDRATLQWAPEVSRQATRLQVFGDFEQYAAVILEEDLPAALGEISRLKGVPARIDIVAGGRRGEAFDPGSITITAERLTECFDPTELRRCIHQQVDSAMFEGQRQADQDEARARQFLNDLAAEPPADD